MSGRLAIFAGVRTPFGRESGALRSLGAEDLGVRVAREVLLQANVPVDAFDGVITGNVGQPSNAANISRVIALRAGIATKTPAWTVHRNCASGFEALTQAADQVALGRGGLYLVIGVESMSNYPLMFSRRAARFFAGLGRARTMPKKALAAMRARPGLFVPRIAIVEGLTDPVIGLNMGQTADLLAREWNITRVEQDAFAAASHQRALAARDALRAETCDVVSDDAAIRDDEGVRTDSTPERLARLQPVFDRTHGTVTAGNSSQITDGGVALIVGDEARGRALGLAPLGFVDSFAYAGCDPARMGLGPVYAIDRLFAGRGVPWNEIDLVEINEAFAAQVMACVRAADDAAWCRRELGRDSALGPVPTDRLNVNGGAIALGHPVGASGARLALTALKELARRGGRRALVSLCVGGGQGGAILLSRT